MMAYRVVSLTDIADEAIKYNYNSSRLLLHFKQIM